MNLPWIALKQYRIESVKLYKYTLNIIKIVMKLRYYKDIYDPVYISMLFGTIGKYGMYAYECDFGTYHVIPADHAKFVYSCQELAESLLKDVLEGF